MKKICFTGHRHIVFNQVLNERLYALIEKLLKNGAYDYYSGGAIGWDYFCSETIISLKKKYPNIKLHLILPCSNKEQTAKWNYEDIEKFYKLLTLADSIEYTSEHYSKDCMKIRNERLVEIADCCICYYSGKYRSGTGQTVRMAERKGITIYNLADF